eukprot:13342836-Alexandrium_andersonii.AAC.1
MSKCRGLGPGLGAGPAVLGVAITVDGVAGLPAALVRVGVVGNEPSAPAPAACPAAAACGDPEAAFAATALAAASFSTAKCSSFKSASASLEKEKPEVGSSR